jgi:predicted ferric reductase
MRGFGGDFQIQTGEDVVSFVAGGVGITPLLGQARSLDTSKIRVFWTLSIYDVALVANVIKQYPELAASISVFFTGASQELTEQQDLDLEKLRQSEIKVALRRLSKEDLAALEVKRWYLCASRGLRTILLDWLQGKDVLFEDFDY